MNFVRVDGDPVHKQGYELLHVRQFLSQQKSLGKLHGLRHLIGLHLVAAFLQLVVGYLSPNFVAPPLQLLDFFQEDVRRFLHHQLHQTVNILLICGKLCFQHLLCRRIHPVVIFPIIVIISGDPRRDADIE